MSNDNPIDESGLRFYGLGIVSQTKPRGSNFVMVTPIEKISMGQGQMSKMQDVYDISSVDVNGTPTNEKIVGETHVKATWLPLSEGNRQTAPDVVEGETVRLFKYGTKNEYYWSTLYREPSIRRLETVLYAWGNLPTGNVPWDKTSSYWFEASTHDKYLHWHTSQSDGEAFAYDFKIDTAASTVTLTDNVGNTMFIDSKNTLYRLQNADGSYSELNKGQYTTYAVNHARIKAPVVHIETPSFKIVGSAESDYHNHAFVNVDKDAQVAELGSGNDAHIKMEKGDTTVKSVGTYTEESGSKITKNKTSVTESGSSVQKYGSTEIHAESSSVSLAKSSSKVEDMSEEYGNSTKKVIVAKEEFGIQDKKAEKVTEKLGVLATTAGTIDQSSQSKTVKSDKVEETYGDQSTTAKTKTESLDSLTATVSGKEERKVGDYLLESSKEVDIRSAKGIKLTDSTISNLDVPGKVKLGGKDLATEIETLKTKTRGLGSDLEEVSNRVDEAELATKTLVDRTKENEQKASELHDKVKSGDEASGQISNRVTEVEERVGNLERKVEKLEARMEEAERRLTEHDKKFEEVFAKIAEVAAAAAEASKAAAAAAATANGAADAAAAAGAAASAPASPTV